MPLHWNTKRQSQNFSVLSANYLPAIFQTSRINSPMSESKRNKCPGSFQQDNEHVRKREEQNVNEIANNIENNNLHDSYYFEQELYQAVKEGNPVKLDHFLNTNKFQSIEEKWPTRLCAMPKSIYRDNNKSGNAWCHSRRSGYRKRPISLWIYIFRNANDCRRSVM